MHAAVHGMNIKSGLYIFLKIKRKHFAAIDFFSINTLIWTANKKRLLYARHTIQKDIL